MVNNDYANCPTFELHPDSNWVEKNILPKYIVAIQKIAVDYFQRITPEGQKYDENGFVDVSSQNVTIPLNTAPINKLKYIPEKRNKDNVVTCEEQWFGFCKGTNKKELLPKQYVENNFLEELIADIKNWGSKGDKKYIPIPPGDAKPRYTFPEHLQKGPEIKYKQEEGQNTCLVFSFASALHHIGAKQAAYELIRKQKKIINKSDTVKRFSVAVRDCDKNLYFKILKKSKWDILNPGINKLVVASLRGSDLKEDHCVTIHNNWVFDSNFKWALLLCKESLDICCSSEETHEEFVSVGEARLCTYGDVLDFKRKQQFMKNAKNQKKN